MSTLFPNAAREAKRIRKLAGRAVVQILFTRPRGMTITHLRTLLRQAFVDATNPEQRAVASLSDFELIQSVVETNQSLADLGLQIQVANAFVQIATTPIEGEAYKVMLAEGYEEGAEANAQLTPTMLEVLVVIASLQPISAVALTEHFDTDKRAQLDRLREMGLLERVRSSEAGGYHFVTTAAFLNRFHYATIEEFRIQMESRAGPIPKEAFASRS